MLKTYRTPQHAAEDYKLAERIGFELAPLQLEDLTLAEPFDRYKWFYDVGVGKTVTSTMKALMMGSPCVLVLVPPIIIPQWVKWLRTVDPEHEVLGYQGTPTQRRQMDLTRPRWIVMSYSIFRDEFEGRITRELGRRHPHIIVDEAHNIKNSGSKLFKRTQFLAGTSPLQLLTGTPTSKPTDAYAFIKLTTPTVYRSLAHFEAMHVAERDYFGTITKYQNLALARDNLMLQATKRTKDEMFPGIVQPRYEVWDYELDPQHKKLYDRLAAEQLLELDNGQKIDATTAQRLYHAMQQIVVNWDQYAGDETKRAAIYDLIDYTIDTTQCMDRERSKLIIWTYYKASSRAILGYLEDFGAVGAYSEVDSNKSVQQFMEDPGIRILVAQPMSAGVGLNPQHVCWENLFVEHSTVPLHFIQSVGRTDRKGQRHMPTMRICVAKDTIQVPLHYRLLHNGDLVQETEGLSVSIREAIYGRESH